MADYALLDLVSIVEGGSAAQALAQVPETARLAESLGFSRYWVAEHHGMPGIASAATALVIAQAGAATERIRVGAGGIMLPNHAPLVIAEQFGTLEALFPGRVDLGLGRAPGSDQRVARALRRNLESSSDAFPEDVLELMRYFADEGQTGVRAVPGAGANVEIWILGSSLFGARLAAALGLPYAFASHFAPQALEAALSTYRTRFEPSAALDRPRVMLGMNVFAGDSEEEAAYVASSAQQAFVAIRTGRAVALPPPVEGYRSRLRPAENALIDHVLSCSAIGTPEGVTRQIGAFLDETGADELIFASMTYDYSARKKSMTVAAQAMEALNAGR
jgi:luciferase family oxidoreductase group 1